ncbi:MAG: 16S rRNA (adenine(1518)-N(6)/adenine(1519)-N(6))-dimethyltransferase RsmA [Patescibacteria group bacterium]|nr:ribosomal RNA small subunit methyltransferase A [Patescibacteria group bacterium]
MKTPAKKSFGQHFLTDPKLAMRIVGAAETAKFDAVVEVGPGPGTLTQWIDHPRLVLIEADRDFIPELKEKFPKAIVIQADAAKANYSDSLKKLGKIRSWVLVGNLPYNSSAAIIMQALRSPTPPDELLVMVQKEQAERMMAKPGEMGLLSVAVQLYAKVERIMEIGPGAFNPPPKVQSTVIRLVRHKFIPEKVEEIITLAKMGFSSRRKQLHKNLAASGVATSEEVKTALEKCGLRANSRAQELAADDWVTIADYLLS